MEIKGINSITTEELAHELGRGAKFVIYQYSISILILSFKQPSDIYFVRSNESAVVKGLPYTLLSLVAGWWGIPWGPIFTIGALHNNLRGGKDVTAEVVNMLGVRLAQAAAD